MSADLTQIPRTLGMIACVPCNGVVLTVRRVIRAYDFTITRGWAAPDGYYKDVMLVNNQFPGPLIEANWYVDFHVSATLTSRAGVTQSKSQSTIRSLLRRKGPLSIGMVFCRKTCSRCPSYLDNRAKIIIRWMDGVPGVQQCPIVPGGSFTYSFLADLYGTTWYHSHYSGQYAGGVVGPLIIHGPSTVAYDTGERQHHTVLLHRT